MKHIEVTTARGERLGAISKVFKLLLSAAEPIDPVIQLASEAITHFEQARYDAVRKMHGDVHILHLLKSPQEMV